MIRSVLGLRRHFRGRLAAISFAAVAFATVGMFVAGVFVAGIIIAAGPSRLSAAETPADMQTPGEHVAAAEHHEVGHADGGLQLENPLEVRTDMAIATLLVFLGLLAILWRFAWGPITDALVKREEGIAKSIADAEEANRDAQAILKEHEKRLADAASEVRAMLEEARRDAEHTKTEIVAEAKHAADAERGRALREIDTATNQALKSLAEKSANLAVELAGKIVQSKLSASEHSKLIEEAMNRFPVGAANGQPHQN